jgi:hypothetical protein
VIDSALITPLGLTATGAIMAHTPSTGQVPVAFAQYDVMLIIPGMATGDPAWIIEALPAVESPLAAQGIHGLLGRDVLDRAILIYNGSSKQFSLAY